MSGYLPSDPTLDDLVVFAHAVALAPEPTDAQRAEVDRRVARALESDPSLRTRARALLKDLPPISALAPLSRRVPPQEGTSDEADGGRPREDR